MLNGIFVFLVLVSFLLAGYTGKIDILVPNIFGSATSAVELAIKLVGSMALFLGLMRVVEDAGMHAIVARRMGPLMRRLFPEIPAGHPAMSAMLLNIAANMLGLANAATPFGIRAMEELDTLNTKKGTATNSMVLFLAINTAGLAILPSGVAALRVSAGSQDAWGIWLPTLFASGCATIVGITAATFLSKLPLFKASSPPVMDGWTQETAVTADDQAEQAKTASAPEKAQLPNLEEKSVIPVRRWIAIAFWIAFAGAIGVTLQSKIAEQQPTIEIVKSMLSSWSLAALVSALVLFGWVRGVKVYESVVEGAKSGFDVALRIIPFLVAILVAVGMFRSSGGIDLIGQALGPLTNFIGMPAEALPMAILRPLSGSGAYGVAAEIMEANGPDSLIGYMVSTFQGSTETTFYVLAVYFGAVRVKTTRHALPACLAADIAGILAAVFIVNLLFN